MKELTIRQIGYVQRLLKCIVDKQKTITYGELAKPFGVSPQTVGKDIGEISKLCHSLGLPLISGMVVNKDTLYPDIDGFGGLCAELGVYQEYSKNYTALVAKCLDDIHSCTNWNLLADYLGIKIEGFSIIQDPIVNQEQEESIEGARIQITATSYERNPENRTKCLNKWGATCQICGFDAANIYGSEFAGLIHVHHIHPLGEIGKEHTIDPENDLIPVCPNCHMILHAKKDGTYTPDEIRAKLILQNK